MSLGKEGGTHGCISPSNRTNGEKNMEKSVELKAYKEKNSKERYNFRRGEENLKTEMEKTKMSFDVRGGGGGEDVVRRSRGMKKGNARERGLGGWRKSEKKTPKKNRNATVRSGERKAA